MKSPPCFSAVGHWCRSRQASDQHLDGPPQHCKAVRKANSGTNQPSHSQTGATPLRASTRPMTPSPASPALPEQAQQHCPRRIGLGPPVISRLITPLIIGVITQVTHLCSTIYQDYFTPLLTGTWRTIPVSKWLITMVIVSPLNGVIPLINGLFMAYKWR